MQQHWPKEPDLAGGGAGQGAERGEDQHLNLAQRLGLGVRHCIGHLHTGDGMNRGPPDSGPLCYGGRAGCQPAGAEQAAYAWMLYVKTWGSRQGWEVVGLSA